MGDENAQRISSSDINQEDLDLVKLSLETKYEGESTVTSADLILANVLGQDARKLAYKNIPGGKDYDKTKHRLDTSIPAPDAPTGVSTVDKSASICIDDKPDFRRYISKSETEECRQNINQGKNKTQAEFSMAKSKSEDTLSEALICGQDVAKGCGENCKPEMQQLRGNYSGSVTENNTDYNILLHQLIQDKSALEKYIVTREQEFERVYACLRQELQELRGFAWHVQHSRKKRGNHPLTALSNDNMVITHICDLQNKMSELKFQLFSQQRHISKLEHERLIFHQSLTSPSEMVARPLQFSSFSTMLASTRGTFAPYGNNDAMVAMVDSCHLGDIPVDVTNYEEAPQQHAEHSKSCAEAEEGSETIV